MNATIETILNHRSIRKFKNEPIKQDELNLILEAATKGSTSSYMMAYSIISITDPVIKKELAAISTQPYVENNGHLLIFCADLNRNSIMATPEEKKQMSENLENTEHLLVATIDATIAAQNAVIASESLGIGICYIGSIRNNISKVDQLLKLPKHVIPLFGLVLGYPDHNPDIKPKLPVKAVHFKNAYLDNSAIYPFVTSFDKQLNDYYSNRSSNTRQDNWSKQMIRKLGTPTRMDVTEFLIEKGFRKK